MYYIVGILIPKCWGMTTLENKSPDHAKTLPTGKTFRNNVEFDFVTSFWATDDISLKFLTLSTENDLSLQNLEYQCIM